MEGLHRGICKDLYGKVKGNISGHSYPIYDHANSSSHNNKLDNFTIMVKESHILARTIKEAMYRRVSDLSLNRDIVKDQLPHIWDEVLFNTPYLHLKQTFPQF